jgi:hypothetical protein
MPRTFAVLTVLLIATAPPARAQSGPMSYFITSVGPDNGADLGGLEGADAYCTKLATSVGATSLTWRAYLSAKAASGKPAVNARDRIGKGPWYNAKGMLVARDLAELHDSTHVNKRTALTEKGDTVNGRGDTPNKHDILTGSALDGTLMTDTLDTTCGNWTSSAADGSARVGHFDRQGGGQNPTSWNSAHPSRGCGLANLRATGGDGLIYCFGLR